MLGSPDIQIAVPEIQVEHSTLVTQQGSMEQKLLVELINVSCVYLIWRATVDVAYGVLTLTVGVKGKPFCKKPQNSELEAFLFQVNKS